MRAALYPASWMIALGVAIAIAIRHRTRIVIFRREYWRWLLAPWKLATFAIAAGGFMAIAPWMDDPYWDRADAAFMSLMTFLTAPWAVAVLWRALLGKTSGAQTYLASCVALFSASWSFDLYQTVRTGVYPDIWWLSLLASLPLYVMAGLFWNLDWSPFRGVSFAFRHPEWPTRRLGLVFPKLVGPVALFMLSVSLGVLVPFFWNWR